MRTSPPKVPGGLPLLGHTLPLLRDPFPFLASLPTYGDLVQVRIGPLKVIVACNPELTGQVLRESRVFDKGGPIVERVREVLGDGLGTCPHDRHRRQRRMIQPAFAPARLPHYAKSMTANSISHANSWHEGQIIDVSEEMTALMLKVLVETMFSTAVSQEVLNQICEDTSTVIKGMYRRTVVPPTVNNIPTLGNRRYRQARARLRRVVASIIADRRSSERIDRGDLLSALLTARDADAESDDQGLSDTEITDHITTFLVAGSETTSNTLAWAFYQLAHSPEFEERLHREIETALSSCPATMETLPELTFASSIIAEALRMYAVPLATRTVTSDIQLGGYSLPAGSTVAYSPYLIHHRSDLYADPERFDPDRWNDFTSSRYAFIPFGGGARKCIGDKFGHTEAVLTLATIAARWKLELLNNRPIFPRNALTMIPKGLRMRVASRQRNYRPS
ncbi:cytochrome P450, partial [Streptomyces sp. NPDC059003]|uniref:cytochrome P450 n=1 Tax=Streptomyces sp. NPDC059003 TaxID=3346691 RepID=UPI00369621CD